MQKLVLLPNFSIPYRDYSCYATDFVFMGLQSAYMSSRYRKYLRWTREMFFCPLLLHFISCFHIFFYSRFCFLVNRNVCSTVADDALVGGGITCPLPRNSVRDKRWTNAFLHYILLPIVSTCGIFRPCNTCWEEAIRPFVSSKHRQIPERLLCSSIRLVSIKTQLIKSPNFQFPIKDFWHTNDEQNLSDLSISKQPKYS